MSTITSNNITAGAQRIERLGKREVTYTWRNPEAQPDAEGKRSQVTLDIYHDADRKRFSASLRLSQYHNYNGYEVVEFALFGNEAVYQYLPTKAVARYSAKALTEYEAETLALLNDNADAPNIARWHELTANHAGK